MTAQTPTTLKTYFNTGDVPTEAQFADVMDTFAPLAGSNTFTAQNIIQIATESAHLLLRHGGETGEGFIHPAAAQAALYVTGRHVSPPVASGGVDLANFYLGYSGDLSIATGTLENVEVVTDLRAVTASPAQAVIALEVNTCTTSANTGITFPNVMAIYGDVGISVDNGGTITWARSVSGVLPSGSSTTGNAITNAAALYAYGTGGAAGSTIIPTNAYGLYANVPAIGTNKWAIYATGFTEISAGNLQVTTGNCLVHTAVDSAIGLLQIVGGSLKTVASDIPIMQIRSVESLVTNPVELRVSILGHATEASQAIILQAGHHGQDFNAVLSLNQYGGNLLIGSSSASMGFFGHAVAAQPAHVADATDAASVILRLNDLLSRLEGIGLLAAGA